MVHPSASYDPKASLKAIDLEHANNVYGVSAMIGALVNHPDFEKKDYIQTVCMGATTVLPEHVRMAKQQFGAKRAFDGYGMTESGMQWYHEPRPRQMISIQCPKQCSGFAIWRLVKSYQEASVENFILVAQHVFRPIC